MKNRANRRDFLVRSVQTMGAMGMGSQVIGALLGTIYSRAFAESGGTLPVLNPDGFRYVFVSLAGAPPRWMLDMLTTPNGKSDDYVAGGFGNALEVSGSTVNVVNKTFEYVSGSGKKIYLPPVWEMRPSVLDAGSKGKGFSDILDHTLFVRGMDMEINSHGISNARQVAPILGGKSLHGVIADQMGSPIATVINGSPSGNAFRSGKGLGPVSAMQTGNPITALLAPFKNLPNSIVYRSDEVKPVIDQFMDRMDKYAENHRLSKSTLRQAHDSADHLIRLNVDSLASTWDGLLKKYEDLLKVATHPSKGELAGVYDKAIPVKAGDVRLRYDNNDVNKLVTQTDARDIIDESTGKPELARQFALTEFLLTTGLSSTVDLSGGGSVMSQVKATSSARVTLPCDQHGVGSIVSVVATTLYFRGLLSGLTELVRSLKSKNLFEKTIIHISAEFNRSPRKDGSGADHGVSGGSATLISGMFNDVAHVGNVLKNGTPGNVGTWGHAADWKFEDGLMRPIKVNDVARSITAMTNSADIVANGYSLVQPVGNGFWVPKTEKGGNNV